MRQEFTNLEPQAEFECQEACISTFNGRLVSSHRQLPFGLKVQRISRLVWSEGSGYWAREATPDSVLR